MAEAPSGRGLIPAIGIVQTNRPAGPAGTLGVLVQREKIPPQVMERF